ncbi:CCN family member 2-like isoform X1 [Petromyzon marinus]|uniref:CCN family member 2-like isoform X1 n=1 Tax=Petromyzon marinus TaxID=7757 RepID=UPI003F72FA8F
MRHRPHLQGALPLLLLLHACAQVLWPNVAAGQAVGPLPAAAAAAAAAAASALRRPYCEWPCRCAHGEPRCPVGVSAALDGCGCCRVCARQQGDLCTEADTCDPHKDLYCDYSGDSPRYEIGVCAHSVGVGCELNGHRYHNGQSFLPSCKYACTCINGAVGCVARCALSPRPPAARCLRPRLLKSADRCCEEWHCLDSKKVKKSAPKALLQSKPRPVSPLPAAPSLSFSLSPRVFRGHGNQWNNNCLMQSTEWSACSRSCGVGISTRITNDNPSCHLLKERRLCLVRPCDLALTRGMRDGKKCVRVYVAEKPVRLELSGCVSRAAFQLRYCGGCTDGRCCRPLRTHTIPVDFDCPNDGGRAGGGAAGAATGTATTVRWNVMWVRSCSCHWDCVNPNDMFAELGNFQVLKEEEEEQEEEEGNARAIEN